MAVMKIKVANQNDFRAGMAKAIKLGVEYEIYPELDIVEIWGGDGVRVAEVAKTLKGVVLSDTTQEPVQVGLPRPEASRV